MEIPMEYHILFMIMSFVLFIVTILLLFIDTTLQKAVAANIFIVFNIALNSIVSLGFSAINLYSFDSSGSLVNNVYSNMHPFIYIYWIFIWVNIMLIFYCVYIYFKKPWEEYIEQNDRYYNGQELYSYKRF